MNITIKKDGKLIQTIELSGKSLILGRSKTSDIQLLDEMISRHHVRIKNNEGSVTFEDMGSRNGLFFRNLRVKIKEVYPEQSIRVGNYTIMVNSVDPVEQKTMAMLEDGDSKTEIHFDEKDLDIADDDLTTDGPPFEEHSNPFFQLNETSNDASSDSFFGDLGQSNQEQAYLEEPEKAAPQTIEQSTPSDPKPAFANLESAPEASLGDAVDHAFDSSTYKEDDLRSLSPPSNQTQRTSQEKTEDASNPFFSEKSNPNAEEPLDPEPSSGEAGSSEFFFSSMKSNPKIKDQEDAHDIFQQKPVDQEQMVETGAFEPSAKDSQSVAKTEIRNFTESEPPKKPKTKPNKKLMFILSAIILGCVLVLFDKDVRRVFFQAGAGVSGDSSRKGKSEDTRIVLFKIDKIKQSLETKDLNTAKEEMKILLTEYPEHPELQAYLPTYNQFRNQLEAELESERKKKEEKTQQIQLLLSQGEKLLQQNKFAAAVESFEKVLEVDPENFDAQDWIVQAESMQIQHERKEFAQAQHFERLSQIYLEGVGKFQAGEFGLAKELLQKVASENGHPNSKKAKDILAQIATQTDSKLTDRINQAKGKMSNPLTLIEAFKELEAITKQFPQHVDAKNYFEEAKTRMDRKARELYAEGIAQEELAGDFSAALDLYHEALMYAPDPNDEYHRKAKEKIDRLTL